MKFVDTWIVWLAIPVTLIALMSLIITEVRKKRQLNCLFGIQADWKKSSTLSTAARWTKYILLLLALPLLLFAAARPYTETEKLDTQITSRDIAVLFDVSKSMRSADLPPSRMAQAKYLLREITGAFPDDRFALIPFAGSALVSCPLTMDHSSFDRAINELSPASVLLGGTNLEVALSKALESFPENSSATNRVIILMTDGEELTGNCNEVLKKLQNAGITLIVIGFGSPDIAAPVPDDDGRNMQSNGKLVSSKLNEPLLKSIAASTNGHYIHSTVSDTGFAAVKKIIDEKVAPEVSGEKQQEIPVELFPLFAAVGGILILLSLVIPERRSNWHRRSAAVLIMLLCCGALDDDYQRSFHQAYTWQLSGDTRAAEIYIKLSNDSSVPSIYRARAMQNLALLSQHSGREKFASGDSALAQQDLSVAENFYRQALADFQTGKTWYANSFKTDTDAGFDLARKKNYHALLHDMKAAENQLKKIQELKELQQQAQKRTQEAQNQQNESGNKSGENQQNESGNKGGENQQNESGNKGGENQQNESGNKGGENQQNESGSNGAQDMAQKSREAANSAEELANQARAMNQEKLADSAEAAAKDLLEAEKLAQEGKTEAAEKKLSDAAEKLSAVDIQEKTERKDADSKNDSESVTIEVSPQEKKKEAESGAEKVIELLNRESDGLEDAIRQRQYRLRRRVKQDW